MTVTIDPQKDYYAILEIAAGASLEEVKRAYRDLARRYHPDSGSGDVATFYLVQEAYDVLRDVTLRRAYDRQRGESGADETAELSWEFTFNRAVFPVLLTVQMAYLLLDIKPTAKQSVSGRQPLNLALVIDRSNSMRGIRMENVKLAAMDLVEYLEPTDRLAVVTFSDRAEVLIPSTLASNKRDLRSAITALIADGGTEIYQGLLAGIEEVRKHSEGHKVNHVILLTDGRTYGDEQKTLNETLQAASNGIGVSTMGIGEDWNDLLLDEVAHRGGGISQFIQSPSQIRQMLRDHIQGLGAVLARDLNLNINPATYVKVQSAYSVAPQMEYLGISPNNVVSLGRLESEQPLTILLDFTLEQSEVGKRRIARFELEGTLLKDEKPVRLRRDLEVDFARNPVDSPVPSRMLNYMSRLSIYRLQERAWNALEAGDTKQATNLLNAAATRLFDIGYRDLAQAALLEAGRVAQGGAPTMGGRKKLRYGTRSLTVPTKFEGGEDDG